MATSQKSSKSPPKSPSDAALDWLNEYKQKNGAPSPNELPSHLQVPQYTEYEPMVYEPTQLNENYFHYNLTPATLPPLKIREDHFKKKGRKDRTRKVRKVVWF